MKAFKYRIYPTQQQEEKLNDTLFQCSRLYNDLLADRRDIWKEHCVGVDYQYQARSLKWRKAQNPKLAQIHSQVLQNVAKRLDLAFLAFFRRVKAGEDPGYPRFRAYRRYDSFTYPQAGTAFFVMEDKKHLHLSKIGDVRIKHHRQLEGTAKTCTIRRRAGRWYAVITCEVPDAVPLSPTQKVAGVDMGIANFAITSDGDFFPSARFLRDTLATIRRLQRAVSRSKKGSKRRVKRIQALARAHTRLANQRTDMHFKTALALIRKYDLIAVEDLKIRNMVRNHHLALSIQDAAWGNFLNILCGKAEEAGRRIVEVDPRYTSQECSQCGTKKKKPLRERWHSCSVCGAELHRDVNAAKVILQRALKLLDEEKPKEKHRKKAS